MAQGKYQTQQLNVLLETTQRKGASGTFYIKAAIAPDRSPRTRILVWQKGKITYVSSNANLPQFPTLAQKLIKQFKLKTDRGETAINFVTEKVANPTSAREFFENLCKIRVLTWEQIESFCQSQAAIALEQVLPYPGEFQYTSAVEFDLSYGEDCHGLDWSELKQDVARRQEAWASLTSLIPSMEAVPHLVEGALEKISDRAAREHLRQWVDGRHSLVEIAENLDEDPLQIARSYLTWIGAGWIVFKERKPIENKNIPTILSVDDSPIVQTMIGRILGDHYNVLLASNAVDALNLLNQKPVALLLLDVTMPDINGLEMCRTLRSIPKFRELPVIMLTARDSLIDKMKGQIAGTNRYLTKPFDKEKLLEVVGEFIGQSGNTNS
jgi:twitching motility two-component system response regulator PilG